MSDLDLCPSEGQEANWEMQREDDMRQAFSKRKKRWEF